jgi:hypothetical protein
VLTNMTNILQNCHTIESGIIVYIIDMVDILLDHHAIESGISIEIVVMHINYGA